MAVKNFIEKIIEEDINNKVYKNIITRFPPEPNGYLHVGHAKSILLNFSMAKQYNGTFNLRMDDTNPSKESSEYSDAIIDDLRWLGCQWDNLYYASDYFEQLYQLAVKLIENGLAYVCSLSLEEIKEYRGTLITPGVESPDRNRSIKENLDLFANMRAAKFKEGEYVLRAKIDMQAANVCLRDPVMYRILYQPHPHTKEKWCIYPMYDFAHGLSDAIENISHSLCTLEFQNNRALYDWFVKKLMPSPHPQQIEFSRLSLSHTITSKRKLKFLVDNKIVTSWDDPRMPTLAGMRRRGIPAEAIKNFCAQAGISKSDSVLDYALLEENTRDYLNIHAKRAFCVSAPLKVVIENYPEDSTEWLSVQVHPQNPSLGVRRLPFSKYLYIDKDDFQLQPETKFKRLSLGGEVRLRYGYIIKCVDVKYDENGDVETLICQYDKDTLGKNPPDRKVKGVIHWLSQENAELCQLNQYMRLFSVENPNIIDTEQELIQAINPNSLTIISNAMVEKNLDHKCSYQFERLGYYVIDKENTLQSPIWNLVIGLRDNWQKA